jgi:DNA-binding protein
MAELMSFHSTLNFIVMVVVIKPYRRAICQLVSRVACCKNSTSNQVNILEPVNNVSERIFNQRGSLANVML